MSKQSEWKLKETYREGTLSLALPDGTTIMFVKGQKMKIDIKYDDVLSKDSRVERFKKGKNSKKKAPK